MSWYSYSKDISPGLQIYNMLFFKGHRSYIFQGQNPGNDIPRTKVNWTIYMRVYMYIYKYIYIYIQQKPIVLDYGGTCIVFANVFVSSSILV